jgi:hypothetical protein
MLCLGGLPLVHIHGHAIQLLEVWQSLEYL